MELHVLNDASWLSQLDETIDAKVFVKLGRHSFPVAATAVVDAGIAIDGIYTTSHDTELLLNLYYI